MKLTLILMLCVCLLGWATGSVISATNPSFVRSRYSQRWRKTTTTAPVATTARAVELVASTEHPQLATSTEHPQLATSTANSDYDYYGNGEMDNVVHK